MAVHLDRRRLTFYGIAHGGKSLFWHTAELLFSYVLTEAWRMPPVDAGRVLALSMALSALLDIVVARTLSMHGLRVGKAANVQAWATVACGIAFVAFGWSGLLGTAGRGGVAVLCIVAFRLAYVFVDVPQNALLPLLVDGERPRTLLTSARYVAGGMAAMLVTGVLAPLLVRDKASAGAIFAGFTVAVSVIATLGAFLLRRDLLATPRRQAAGHEVPVPSVPPERIRLASVLLAMFAVSAGTSMFGRLEVYFVAYGAHLDVAWLLVCMTAGSALTQPAWVRLSRRLSLLGMLRVAAVGMLAAVVVFHDAAGAGGTVLLVAGFVYGATCGGVLLGLWALAAGVAAERSSVTDPTRTMALLTFSAKMGLATSALVTGWVLHGSDYHSTASGSVLQAMTLAAIFGACACMALYRRDEPLRTRRA